MQEQSGYRTLEEAEKIAYDELQNRFVNLKKQWEQVNEVALRGNFVRADSLTDSLQHQLAPFYTLSQLHGIDSAEVANKRLLYQKLSHQRVTYLFRLVFGLNAYFTDANSAQTFNKNPTTHLGLSVSKLNWYKPIAFTAMLRYIGTERLASVELKNGFPRYEISTQTLQVGAAASWHSARYRQQGFYAKRRGVFADFGFLWNLPLSVRQTNLDVADFEIKTKERYNRLSPYIAIGFEQIARSTDWLHANWQVSLSFQQNRLLTPLRILQQDPLYQVISLTINYAPFR